MLKMSFARAKIARFNESNERPLTANSNNHTSNIPSPSFKSSSQKSLIPKFRSLSQPPSLLSVKEHSIGETKVLNESVKNTIDEVECIATDNSTKSDEFKDCLEVKIDVKKEDDKIKNNDTNVENNNNNEIIKEKCADIVENNDKQQHNDDAEGLKPESKQTTRKCSTSGIPICCVKSPVKNSPKSPNSRSAARKTNAQNASTIVLTDKPVPNKRTLDMFISRKRRFEQLKKEIIDKQKPLMDLYQNLKELKKKLNDCGRNVTLEPFSIVECMENVSCADLSGGGEALLAKVDLDESVLAAIKNSIKEIPQNLYKLCMNLMSKRNSVLLTLEEAMDPNSGKDIKLEIDKLRLENEEFDVTFHQTLNDQETIINDIMNKLSKVQTSTSNLENSNELQEKVKQQDSYIKELTNEVSKLKQQLKEKTQDKNNILEEENRKLVDKNITLEKQVENEKRKLQYETDKVKSVESSVKTLKAKAKENETVKQQYETKVNQLSHELRSAQQKIKQIEKGYEKEILELNRARHLDKSTIERLNKDHATFETRLKTANEGIEYAQRREKELIEQLDVTKGEADLQTGEMMELRNEVNNLHKQVAAYETQARQTADILSRRQETGDYHEENLSSDCDLQLEICSQRAAIRALQDKLEANATEKLRFIETIEKLNGKPAAEMNEGLLKTIVRREEEITSYERQVKEKTEVIEQQKIEIEKLMLKEKQLTTQLETISSTSNEESDELKTMVKEGKNKLEQALMKCLENEHKIIKYEHDLAQKAQTIATLENMMKVRDGLVNVIKAKKDELAMENHSLTKYSEEIRTYVLKSKEELREKQEIIMELQQSLDKKISDIHRLEGKNRELEDKLVTTNEKRFKLQDTVTYMEKELQSTKAHMQQYEDMQTRYELGRISDSKTFDSLPQWNQQSASLYNKYRAAYEQEKNSNESLRRTSVNTLKRAAAYPQINIDKLDPTKSQSMSVLSIKSSYTHKILYNNCKPSNTDFTLAAANCKTAQGTMFNSTPQNEFLGAGQEYEPVMFDGIERSRNKFLRSW